MFKKDDKVKIVSGIKAFEGLSGTVLDVSGDLVKVKVNLSADPLINKRMINIFEASQLQLESLDLIVEDSISYSNDLEESQPQENKIISENKGEIKMNKNQLKLTNEELVKWMDDNDANYWTQDITEDNKVAIKGLHKDIAEYDFNTHILTLNENYEESEDDEDATFPEFEEEEDFIYDYVYDLAIDDEDDEIPSWEFAGIIASAENMDERDVIQYAMENKYKVFLITAGNTYEKAVIAAKQIKEEDIQSDYADYLEGNATVKLISE